MTDSGPKGSRRTVQKDIVTSALADQTKFVSAQSLHRLLAEAGHTVGLATVYRHLNALVAAGRADSIVIAETQMFRACDLEVHHHHLVCERCGRAFEVDPPDESWIETIADRYGFVPKRHLVEVFGLCRDCAAYDHE